MKRIVFLLLTSTLFFSCVKKEDCGTPGPLDIEHNGPVVEGWYLRLKTNGTTAYRFRWYGPNGWKKEFQTFASDANEQTRTPMTMQDAGEYKVQWVDGEGCIKYEGKVNIQVVPPPPAPCTVTKNSSTSSVAGIGAYSYSPSFLGSGNFYYVSGASGGPGGAFIRLAFPGQEEPKPGIYETAPQSFGLDYGTVGVMLQDGTVFSQGAPGRKVYVTKVNNKLVVGFCSLPFSNPFNPSAPFLVSANFTQQ